ncbi:hypothetical protein DPMN_105406 [Dreissena polymorpha]|uniref:Uncharacterized protein n=1 Tax=Dreissena polymorpha TaxID=45954 RepID=A0A9D4K2A1_DREPO|nr:hypothetical protein DPMN_105406 [Dreissena polymorpha]
MILEKEGKIPLLKQLLLLYHANCVQNEHIEIHVLQSEQVDMMFSMLCLQQQIHYKQTTEHSDMLRAQFNNGASD